MTPPADQTFELDVLSRSFGGIQPSYSLDRPNWRYVQTAMAVTYVCLGIAYLVRREPDLFLGAVFLILGVLQGLQVAGILKRPAAAPTFSLNDTGVRYTAAMAGTDRFAAWADVESVAHRAGRIAVSVRGGLPIVVAFADVSYAQAQAMKEATDAWARSRGIPVLSGGLDVARRA